MPYRADVTEPDPNVNIISKYRSEPGPAPRVPSGPDGLGLGIHPLVYTTQSHSQRNKNRPLVSSLWHWLLTQKVSFSV